MRGMLLWLAREALPPLVLLALVLAAWQGAVTAFAIPPYLLPGPLAVLRAAQSDAPRLLAAMGYNRCE